MKRYIKLAKHYAQYRKFCDMLHQLCELNERNGTEGDYDPAQNILEYDVFYMMIDNPALAELAIDFKLDVLMLRKYPKSLGLAESLHDVANDPYEAWCMYVYGR